MKIIYRTTIVVLMSLLCAYGRRSRSISPTDEMNDVRIQQINDTIFCDSFVCPPDSISCIVTKINDPKNFSQLVRYRKCTDEYGRVTFRMTTYEDNRSRGNVTFSRILGHKGIHNVSLNELRELQESLENWDRKFEEHFKKFNDGTFEKKMENKFKKFNF